MTPSRFDTAKMTRMIASGRVTSQWTSFTKSPDQRHRHHIGSRSNPVIKPLAQLLAGLEEGNVLLLDLHAVAGARVATETRIAPLHRKGAEAAQLNAVAARQRRGDLIENGGHDTLDVALIEIRVTFSPALDNLPLPPPPPLLAPLPLTTHPP